jgi:AcrR family transcriptional regulator
MSPALFTVDPERRPLRADAQRNRARLLEAAEAVFTAHGTEASLDDIARRAGVGIGTLYRHFPTRDDLVESLIHSMTEEVIARGQELLEADDAFAALHTWLQSVLRQNATYRGLAGSMVDASCGDSRLGDACQRQQAVGAELVARAQEQGSVRPDVTWEDVIDLTSAIALVIERGPRHDGDRLLGLALDGLRYQR